MTVKIDGTNTVANPAFTGADTDTGLQCGTNELKLVTGGTARATVDSSGRVGINNTVMSSFTGNASDNLVVGSGSGGEGITVYSATNNQGSLTFADGTSGDAAYRGAVEYSHTNDRLAFRTAGTGNRMVIDSSGNVGINNTSPSSYDSSARNLVVGSASGNQGITIAAGTGSSSAINFADGTSGSAAYTGRILYQHSADALTFHTNAGGEAARFDSSRRLLIGTSSNFGDGSTGDALQVATTAGGHLLLGRNNSSVAANQTIGLIRGYSYGGSAWQEAARISIQADGAHASGDKPGRIVLATTADGASSPTERLRIDSSGFITQKFTSNNSSTPEGLLINNENNATGNNASLIFSNDSGNRKKIAIAAVDVGNYGASDLVFALDGADSGSVSLSSDEKMRIDSSGNVGIGETSPDAKLHIRDSTDGGSGDTRAAIRFSRRNGGSYDAILHTVHNGNDGVMALRLDIEGSEYYRFTNNGLTFNGDTASANALSDYEEGTWTPTFASTGGSFSSVTYSLQSGHYTKIGERVYWDCRCQITAHSVGTAGGGLLVAGLPYTVNSPQGLGGNVALSNIDVPTNVVNLATEMRENTTQFYAALYTRDNASFNNITPSNLPSGICEIRASGMYYTN